ncbi:hypothetical protein ACEPAI_2058 [Sanghuangporus weigelae]
MFDSVSKDYPVGDWGLRRDIYEDSGSISFYAEGMHHYWISYVVVGASRNLGLGFVRYLSSDPKNKVFALVRNKATTTQLQEYVDSDANKYRNVIVIEADLNDYKSIKAAATAVSEVTGGELDVLINNGALLHQERNWVTIDEFPDEETLEEDFLTFFKTNAIGATHVINAFIPLLRAGTTKKILAVTSSLGSPLFALVISQSACPAYSISKAALNMVIAKFATRFKNDGFTFLAVSPGLIKTMPGPPDVVDKIYEGEIAKLRQINPNFGFVSVEQSVKDQISLLEKMTPADAFVHANGDDANYPSY